MWAVYLVTKQRPKQHLGVLAAVAGSLPSMGVLAAVALVQPG
jgi:flagellar motor component MotA